MGEVHRFRRHKPINRHQRRQRTFQGRPRKHARGFSLMGVAVIAALVGVPVGYEFAPPLFGCNVKGNISPHTGERIYHVPGQEYYRQTRVSIWSGERWFCSEVKARAAGWRKSRV